MDFWRILIFFMIVYSVFSAWKGFRKKLEKAKGEEEMRHAFVSFLVMIILFLIAIAVFVF